jgi:hypothetical protein
VMASSVRLPDSSMKSFSMMNLDISATVVWTGVGHPTTDLIQDFDDVGILWPNG